MRALMITAILVFAADQLSKLAVVHWLDLKTIGSITVLPPLLNFEMGWNTGINFGLFSESPDFARYVLITLALVISAFLIWWAPRNLSRRLAVMGAGAIVGGALANALDRVVYGAVADFLNMSCCGINNPYTFNVADIGIFAGAFAVIIFGDDKTDAKTT